MALQRAAMARAAVEKRQAKLWKEAADASARLSVANKAYDDGDIRVASRMFVSVALRHRNTPAGKQARERLGNLAQEARGKLAEIDTRLAGQDARVPPIDPLTGDYGPPAEPSPHNRQELVTESFRQYSELAELYEGVPEVARELRRHVSRQRRVPEYAVVLNEPQAKKLWELGQQHEAKGEACCAYWTYERAARLGPAPSALRAGTRIAEMKQGPEVVASAENCKCIRECHELYLRAEKLVELRPVLARERFAEIVRRAPEDSEVHRLAKKRLATL